MKRINNFLRNMGHTPLVPGLILLASALTGLWHTTLSGMVDASLALWGWGAAMFLPFYAQDTTNEHYQQQNGMMLGWILIPLSLVLLALDCQRLAVVLLLTATTIFFGNLRLGGYALGAFFVWLFVMPHEVYIHYLISQPLREIGATVSALVMSLCGFDAYSSGTDVVIGSRRIVITAACSGIEQLEAMVLAGWIVVLCMQKKISTRLLHFLMILPVILFANILRVVLTLLGAEWIGSVMFNDKVHTAMGYGMVMLVILLFIGIGTLFPTEKQEPSQKEEVTK